MLATSVFIKPSSGMYNMHCNYCFYCDETQKQPQKFYGFMSEETLKNVIHKTILRAEGAVAYAFQGGGPTPRGIDSSKKATTYETQHNRYHAQVRGALQTNGYLLDDEWCCFLKENHFLVDSSLDGTEEANDMYRHASGCESISDRTFQATGLLEKHGVDFNTLTVVTNNITAHIKEVYEPCRKQNWDYQQYIACPDPLDEEHGKDSYILFSKQYKDLLITLFHLWCEDWKKSCQSYIRQLENHIGTLMGYRPEVYDWCGVCNIRNVVETDGSVYFCDSCVLDEYRLGSSNADQLSSIDRYRQETGFTECSKKSKGPRLSCFYYNIYRGGCQRNRDLNPENGLYDSYLCESCRISFDACLSLMEEITKKQSIERQARLFLH